MSQKRKLINRLRAILRNEDGGTLIEGAIVVPVLMSLLGGVYEFSFFFYQQQLISTGIRDAARYLARTSDPTSSTNQGYAKNIAIYGSVTATTQRVPGWTTSNVSVTVNSEANSGASTPCGTSACNDGTTCTDANGNSYACVQVVVISTSFTDPALGFFGFLGLGAPSISISHSERFIGPG